MNNKSSIGIALSFLVYFLLQIVFFKELWLWENATCLIYIAPLILMDTQVKDYVFIFIAFLLGFTIDVFYDKLGINAFACVFIGFLRPFILKIFNKNSFSDDTVEYNIRSVGFSVFAIYSLFVIFIHHFVLFMIDASNTSLFGEAFLKTFYSTLFTFFILICSQMLYHARDKHRR